MPSPNILILMADQLNGTLFPDGPADWLHTPRARRHAVYPALRNDACFPWDYQPLRKASERYMRNHMDLNLLEENKRFPHGD